MFTTKFAQRLFAYLRAEKTYLVKVCVFYNHSFKFYEEVEVKAYTKWQAKDKAHETVKNKLSLNPYQVTAKKTKNFFQYQP
jgi:hypothetical protein